MIFFLEASACVLLYLAAMCILVTIAPWWVVIAALVAQLAIAGWALG